MDDLYKLHDEYDNYKNKKEREAETPRDDENTEEINEKYNNIIQSLNNKYIFSNTNNSCHEIEILKEKMKLELTKEINNTVLK